MVTKGHLAPASIRAKRLLWISFGHVQLADPALIGAQLGAFLTGLLAQLSQKSWSRSPMPLDGCLAMENCPCVAWQCLIRKSTGILTWQWKNLRFPCLIMFDHDYSCILEAKQLQDFVTFYDQTLNGMRPLLAIKPILPAEPGHARLRAIARDRRAWRLCEMLERPSPVTALEGNVKTWETFGIDM